MQFLSDELGVECGAGEYLNGNAVVGWAADSSFGEVEYENGGVRV